MSLNINIRKENLLFFSFNFLYFSCSSLYFGFLVIYLSNNGFSSLQCNLINTLICACSFLFQPIAGFITDTFLPVKKYLIGAAGLAMVSVFLLPLSIKSLPLTILAIVIMSLLFLPLCFLADTWAVTLRERYPHIDYGKVRSGGSMGYAFTSIIAGNLISVFSYNVLFLGTCILLTLLIIVISFIPKIPCANKGGIAKEEKSLNFSQTIKLLLKNKNYMLFLISCVLFYSALRPIIVNIPYKVMNFGGGDIEVGIANSVAAICELPILFSLRRLVVKYKISYLYLVATIMLALRALLLFVANDFYLLLLSQGIQAFAYSLFLTTTIEYISRTIPANIRATGVTISIAMTNGFASIIGTIIGGLLMDSVGFDVMSGIMCIVAVTSFLSFAIPIYFIRKKDSDLVV